MRQIRWWLALTILSCATAQNPDSYKSPLLDSDVGVATNALTPTLLVGNIGPGATSFTLSSATGWLAPVYVTIDNEVLMCTTLTGAVLSGCTATAASHNNGTRVLRPITANAWNQAMANLKILSGVSNASGVLKLANGGCGTDISGFTSGAPILAGNPCTGSTVSGTGTQFPTTAGPTIDSPVFTTKITTPIVIGGTTTTSPLILRSTSGVGIAGADIIFQTGNNGGTEAMRILNNGNIGIGTTMIPDRLVVQGGSASAEVARIVDAGGNYIWFQPTSGNQQLGSSAGAINLVSANGLFRVTNSGQNSKLWVDDTSQTTQVQLNSSGVSYLNGGNVGIGTTSPNVLLTIGGASATGAANGLNFSGDTAANLYRSAAGQITTDGTILAPSGSFRSPLFENTSAGTLTVQGGVSSPGGKIVYVGGTFATDPGSLQFFTGTSASPSQVMEINSSGNVGIGTTNPGAKLTSTGDVFITSSSFGVILTDSAAACWRVVVAPITGALSATSVSCPTF